MKSVRYTKGSKGIIRVMRPQDLDRLHVPHDGEDLVWNQANNFTIVMNNRMSDSLVERLPTEFVAEDADEADNATSTAQSNPEASQSAPEASEDSGDEEVKRSTRKRSKKL
jgi:hypothetical protein